MLIFFPLQQRTFVEVHVSSLRNRGSVSVLDGCHACMKQVLLLISNVSEDILALQVSREALCSQLAWSLVK